MFHKKLNTRLLPVFPPATIFKFRNNWLLPIEMLSSEFSAVLDERNIRCHQAQIFFSPPDFVQEIHTDGNFPTDDDAKLNYVIGGSTSLMNWYETDSEGEPTFEFKSGDDGYKASLFDPEKCRLVESAKLELYNIVKVGIPHNVVNSEDNGRWCLSLILHDKTTDHRLGFNELCDRFREFI